MNSANRISGLVLCTALLAAGEVRVSAESAPGRRADDEPAPYGMVCHRETVTGSYIRRRICRTPEEEAIAQADARHLLDEMRRNRGDGNRRAGVSTAEGTGIRN